MGCLLLEARTQSDQASDGTVDRTKKKKTNKQGRKRGNLEKLKLLIYNSIISKSYVLLRKLASLERLNNEKAWVARRTLTSGKVY